MQMTLNIKEYLLSRYFWLITLAKIYVWWWGCKETGLSHTTSTNANWYNYYVGQFHNINACTPFDPAIPFLGTYPKDIHKSGMVIAALFVKGKYQK